jgi:predicted transcriptional regulator
MHEALVTREEMLHAIRSLPEDAAVDDAAYALEVVEAIKIGIAQADAGLTIPHEEVEREMATWLEEDAAHRSG